MRRLLASLAAMAFLASPAVAQQEPDAVGVFVHDGSYFRIDETGEAVWRDERGGRRRQPMVRLSD